MTDASEGTEFSFTDYDPYDFANRRHIGPSPKEIAEMLEVCGADSLDALIDETVPKAIRQDAPLDWGKPLSEREVLFRMREVANRNRALVSLIGQGYYGTVTPPVIQRNILENPAWYTSYTPYQPEISQGRLEALLNFQTMVTDLTDLDVANASLLDEATAAAEAMALAHRAGKSKSDVFFVDAECHPQTIDVVRTRAEPLGLEVIVGDPFADLDPSAVFGALFQYPGTHGVVRDFTPLIEKLHENKALACVAAEKAGADEALMLDVHGFVNTTNSCNFFIVRKGEVWTSTGDYCMNGITRRKVLDQCRADGIPAYERNFSLVDCYGADEAFLTGTFGAQTPVGEIDGRRLPAAPGPVTERIRALYMDLVRRRG